MNRLTREGQSSAPTRVRRHPPEVRRRLIIEAARGVMARCGTAATTLREVAAAAGVSLGTVSYHFTAVDQLLDGVIELEESEFFQPILEQALAAKTGRDGLRHLVDCLLNEEERTREHWLLWLDYWTLASHNTAYGRRQHAWYGKWRKALAELVARGHDDGTLTVMNQALAVSRFMALMDGVAAHAYLTGRDSPIAEEGPNALMWALIADLVSPRPETLQLSGSEHPSMNHSRGD
jgi:AcrR family transcriptional regulator